MKLKEISKDIYDVDAWMDEQYGKVGSPERNEFRKEAYSEKKTERGHGRNTMPKYCLMHEKMLG